MRLRADHADRSGGIGFTNGLDGGVGGHAAADNQIGIVGHLRHRCFWRAFGLTRYVAEPSGGWLSLDVQRPARMLLSPAVLLLGPVHLVRRRLEALLHRRPGLGDAHGPLVLLCTGV